MKWSRTKTGVENEAYSIDRKMGKNIFTGRDMKPDYIVTNKQTGERYSFGTMKDAKWFAEQGWV